MKICNNCKKQLPLSSFGLYKKRGKLKYFGRCKECENNRSSEYGKTKDGLITKIYSNQKKTSKNRGHKPPSYTKEELKEWLYSQQLFHELYDDWKNSNYSRWKVPSCDRKNEFEGYSLKNIKLMTWEENNKKSHIDLAFGKGKSGEQCKAVKQYSFSREWNREAKTYIYRKIELIGEYFSTKDAQDKTGCRRKDISDCAIGRRKSAQNYIWEYVA